MPLPPTATKEPAPKVTPFKASGSPESRADQVSASGEVIRKPAYWKPWGYTYVTFTPTATNVLCANLRLVNVCEDTTARAVQLVPSEDVATSPLLPTAANNPSPNVTPFKTSESPAVWAAQVAPS